MKKSKFIGCNIAWAILSAGLFILWKMEERDRRDYQDLALESERKRIHRDHLMAKMHDGFEIDDHAYEIYEKYKNDVY